MKVYFYSGGENINSYLLVDESTKEAIIVDPTNIEEHLISKIEEEHFLLKLALITNPNIDAIVTGLSALKRIYDFDVSSSNNQQKHAKYKTNMRRSINKLGGSRIEILPLKLNCEDFYMYKVGNVIFTGMVFLDGFFYRNGLSFIEKSWFNKIRKLLSGLDEHTFLFPLSGPPTTIKTMKFYTTFL